MAVATAFLGRGRGVEIGLVLLGVLLGVLIYLSPPWLYPWVKAAHMMSIIAWMAGMLYLPRLFVYHTEAEIGSKQSETFKIMERRLFKGIIKPPLILTRPP